MIWMAMMLLMMIGCLTPMTVQVDVRHDSGTRGRIRAQWLMLHKTWKWDGQEPKSQPHKQRKWLWLGDKQPLVHLLRHCHVDALYALILLRAGDAAKAALLSGALQGIVACVPALHRDAVHIRVLPEFFQDHSTIRLRCIIRVKVGILILTAGMLALRLPTARQLKESEAM